MQVVEGPEVELTFS
uniref:Uncharacterized protein n=1 Tax=Arundo donax TaxID=35708 RepID=A0A0A9E361_ARUDO